MLNVACVINMDIVERNENFAKVDSPKFKNGVHCVPFQNMNTNGMTMKKVIGNVATTPA